MSGIQGCGMVMKINLDCNACCRKMRRIILRMKVIEKFDIDKQHSRVIVCGKFIPADVAIKIRKKMKRRVEILEIQEFSNVPNEQHVEQGSQAPELAMTTTHFQFSEHHHAIAQPA